MNRDLRPLGPVEVLDRALLLVRRGGGMFFRSVLGGLLVAFVVVGAYYVERVEGVRSIRPLIAFALVLAWWGRALLLSSAARDATRLVSEGLPMPEGAGRPVDVLRTASVVGFGLWCWLWLLVGASMLGTFAVPLVLPLLALRGAVAPSWLARAGATTDGGFRAFGRAVSDGGSRRANGITVEFLVLLGAVGLAVNLFATIAVFLLLGRSMLGLDVAFVDSFLSARNVFVLLIVGSLALVLLEPLRVAISALAYVDSRVRQEGLDLRAAVDEAVAAAARRGGAAAGASKDASGGLAAGGRTAAAVLLVTLALGAPAARAQPVEGDPTSPPAQLIPLPPGTGPSGVAPPVEPGAWDPTGSGMPPKQPIDFDSLAA